MYTLIALLWHIFCVSVIDSYNPFNKKTSGPVAMQENHPKKQEKKTTILRFKKSERFMHWALALPFLVCFFSALILVIVYNPDPTKPYRLAISWIHRISGILLIILPLIAGIKSRRNLAIHYYNIKQAWVWTIEDLRWLALMGLAAISSKFTLPEQGKFNAAEKLNFMNLMVTYPLYIITGLIVWMTDNAYSAWMVHFLMAAMVIPLLGGHLFMAIVNPSSRKGLPGMFSGYVDRDWAKHHYTGWYKEHFKNAR